MNTSIHMILETFPFSFRMVKGILKDYKVFIRKVKGSSSSSIKKKRNNTKKKKSSREIIRKKAQGKMIPFWHFKTLKKECPIYLKKKRKYTSFSHFWVISNGFHHLCWINSKPTVYKSLQGIQQVRRLNDGIIITLASNTRLVLQVSGR